MKLIIDIPDNEYKYTCERTLHDRSIWDDAIRKGTPLDDALDKIRAEIAVLDDADYDYEGYYKAITDAIKIIDKYKAESEER